MKHFIYLDNAATSYFKPACVKKAFIKSLKNSSNPGRSGHKLSIKNSLKVWETRQNISSYFNNQNPEDVIFTKNCTEAINLLLFGLLKQNDLKSKIKNKKTNLNQYFINSYNKQTN